MQAIDPIDGRIANSAHFISYMGGELAYSSRFVGWIAIGVIIITMASMEFYRRYNFIRKTKIDRAVHDRTRVMEEVQKQLRQQSRIDSLTGLLNRHAVLDELSYLMSALIPDELIAVALIDIDHFKHINDTFGHQGGDFVLEQYGLRLRQACDSRVAAGRYGGEELILVFSTVKIRNNIIEKMNSIHHNLVDPILFGKDDISVTCSVGLAFFSAGDTSSSLVGRADRALYKGKRNGRNCIVVAD
ncbi:GGDEF domain-containing protein [Acetobacter oeni]|uniref:GGDEF domain-containing protein n=1 Tax=Acetobacter oeni TaxID=304077 RepID=UPI001569881F|nr:GGDEF domain-containing protein [Acetobacter oeni]MBB3885025.1 diguanylate cyclase (GGDEF)-like protein [Acetobacter oeni]NHO20881.1 diguanylate cyclase [Acetobacter oeni]